MSELLANGKVTLMCGDSRERILDIPDDSIDSIVTDPPYALVSIVKRFGKEGSAPPREILGEKGAFNRSSRGFMGSLWDTGETAFAAEFWNQTLRVLKPGGHLVAFSGTRTYHRMTCAIEDGGFEIRDQIGWAYGSGFPKSHDVSKGIDKHLFREWLDADPARRAAFDKEIKKAKNLDHAKTIEDKWKAIGSFLRGVVAIRTMPNISGRDRNGIGPMVSNAAGFERGTMEHETTQAATALAAEWEGWGTALKPAWEPICLARKPLVGTVVDNVLMHRTGGIHIDACRIDGEKRDPGFKTVGEVARGGTWNDESCGSSTYTKRQNGDGLGRFPANLLHDGSAEVMALFPDTGPEAFLDSGGSAARFFYSAKADGDDRLGSKHPTVKPVDLMQWLVRLVTPKGGTVLDCFAGTGTTGEAAFREGFNAVLIEREPEYQNDIRRRMSLVLGGPQERRRASIKASGKTVDAGPLFA